MSVRRAVRRPARPRSRRREPGPTANVARARSCRSLGRPAEPAADGLRQRLLAAPDLQQLGVAVAAVQRRPLALGQRALDRPRAARGALDVDADLGASASAISARSPECERLKRSAEPGSSGLPCGPAANSTSPGCKPEPAGEHDPQRGARDDPARARRPAARRARARRRRASPRGARTSSGGWASSTCQTSTVRTPSTVAVIDS